MRVDPRGRAQARDEAGVFGDVVRGDADELRLGGQDLHRARVADQRTVPGGAGVAARAAVGLDEEPGHYRPDSAVRTRIRRHSSQRTTSSGAAARIWFRSTVFRLR